MLMMLQMNEEKREIHYLQFIIVKNQN